MCRKPSKITKEILKRAIKKAKKLPCRYKISAIGYDENFKSVGIATNSFRNRGGEGIRGLHAEERLIMRYGKLIKYIFIVRTNRRGSLLPIDPCEVCSALCKKYGIEIIKILPDTEILK